MKDEANISDEATIENSPGLVPERRSYTVVSEAGLFKNGKQYDRGDVVELDARTAAAFAETGDIDIEGEE